MSRYLLAALLLLFFVPVPSEKYTAQDEPNLPDRFILTQGLGLPGVGYGGRSPVYSSNLIASIVDGSFTAPAPGDKVLRADDASAEWRKVEADEDGWVSEQNLAYVFWSVESDKEQVAILKARGHSSVYVNGESRGGDPYNYGYVELPVVLKKGTNQFLFNTARGRVKASLERIAEGGFGFSIGRDWTLPDLLVGAPEGTEYLASVNVMNMTPRPARMMAELGGFDAKKRVRFTRIPAMSVGRLQFVIVQPENLHRGEHELELYVCTAADVGEPNTLVAETTFKVSAKLSHEPRKVTFESAIDGSVQYYAVRPARPLPEAADKPGIVLSLHGASVEARGQAGAYSSKSWCHIVCPTNRRPYGFDWEDWGRLDALEVLAHAQSTLDNDPTKVWLTGHSMGGHGSWTIGSHFPDKFAAIGPSAGWEDFWSYGGGAEHPEDLPVSEILTRAANPYRTLLRKHNYSQQGVYILHGDADDNVPVTQARKMRDVLKEFHTDLAYYEEPEAGHWWDRGHDAGADCLDWRPMFDMFARRRLPHMSEVQQVDFTTVCPEHSADCHWARIEMQEKQFAPSRVQIELFPNRGVFDGTTDNVVRMSLQVAGVISEREKLTIKLDGGELTALWPSDQRIFLERIDGVWKTVSEPDKARKGPHRYGWFKNAFQHGFLYVYGTQGTPEETAAYLAKSRFDQETWYYRANGGFDIVADENFNPADYPDRNVILVGNADTNGAWDKLLKDCPLRVGEGQCEVGDRTVEGDDLAMLFIYPRAGTENNCIGVIGGTGVKGIKLTERLGCFVSGAAFPDFIVYSPEMLQTGTAGVVAAGFLGEDWSLERGEVAWREKNKDE